MLVLLLYVFGLFSHVVVNDGAFHKPDMSQLQAEGDMLVSAIHQYEKIHGRLPNSANEILADDKNIPSEAKNLLINSNWIYYLKRPFHPHPNTFFIYKYTGHMGDVLWYGAITDETGNQQYRWMIRNWK